MQYLKVLALFLFCWQGQLHALTATRLSDRLLGSSKGSSVQAHTRLPLFAHQDPRNGVNSYAEPIHEKQALSRSAECVTQQALNVAGVVLSASALSAIRVNADDDSTFVESESGLKYRDIKIGDGASPVPGDAVRVHYTGWLDGFESEKKFDSSYDRRTPLGFKVGVRQVIAGWDEALLTNMKVGTKRQVIIPPALGYGARGAGGVIPPNATLYFTMELVGIGAKANR